MLLSFAVTDLLAALLAFCKVAICFITFVTWMWLKMLKVFFYLLFCVRYGDEKENNKTGGRRRKKKKTKKEEEEGTLFQLYLWMEKNMCSMGEWRNTDTEHTHTHTHTNSVHFSFFPFIQAKTDSNKYGRRGWWCVTHSKIFVANVRTERRIWISHSKQRQVTMQVERNEAR